MKSYKRLSKRPKELTLTVFNEQIKKLTSEIDKLKNDTTSKQDESIREKYNQELGDLKGKYGNQLKELGLTVDWSRVKDAYINGAESVDKAFHSEYGAELVKLYKSKAKLNKTKALAETKPKVVEQVAQPVVNEEKPSRKSRQSYSEMVASILAQNN